MFNNNDKHTNDFALNTRINELNSSLINIKNNPNFCECLKKVKGGENINHKEWRSLNNRAGSYEIHLLKTNFKC